MECAAAVKKDSENTKRKMLIGVNAGLYIKKAGAGPELLSPVRKGNDPSGVFFYKFPVYQ